MFKKILLVKMLRSFLLQLTTFATVLLLVQFVSGAVPPFINIQGRLTDANGVNLPDGPYALVISIWDAANGGTQLWEETWDGPNPEDKIYVKDGIFQAILGEVTPIPASVFQAGSIRYLQLQVGSDPPLLPRQKMVSVGYAYKCEVAERSTGDFNVGNNLTVNGIDIRLPTYNSMLRIGPITGANQQGFYWGGHSNGLIIGDYSNPWPGASSVQIDGNLTVNNAIKPRVIIMKEGTDSWIGKHPIENSLHISGFGTGSRQISLYDSVSVEGPLGVSGDTYLMKNLYVGGYKGAALKDPRDPNKKIYFCTTESPKVAFEDFGEATLNNGEANVSFDEKFQLCISAESIPQIIVTPMGECNGLYIDSRSNEGFVVKELKQGMSNVTFCWRAIAIRKGYENYEPAQ